MENTLTPLNRISGGGDPLPKRKPLKKEKNFELLMQAQQYWTAMFPFRKDRERNKRYLYGDQWGDKIKYKDKWIFEGELIAKQGNVPLKNNLIRGLVNRLIGLYREQNREPTCVARERSEQVVGEAMSTLLQYDMQLNSMGELRAREMEEFCISGLVVERKWHGRQNGKTDCWTSPVQPNNFIIDNNMADPRGWDCGFVGEIHDVSFESLCKRFAHTQADYDWLKDTYSTASNRDAFSVRWNDFGFSPKYLYNYDFFVTEDIGRCRVIEVWRKETKPRYRCHDWNNGELYKIDAEDKEKMVDTPNRLRKELAEEQEMPLELVPLIEAEWFLDEVWKYYYLTPYGDVLEEGETPYAHGSHPYAFKAYPFIDGEIHSFVSEVIDQQRFINRLIIMHDMAIRSSAKGLMMVPIECIPEGMDPRVFAEECTSYNGMMFYRSKGVQHLPQVITSNSTNIGTSELLSIQMKIMEDASGIHGALQGKAPTSGTSATLYALETQNSSTSLIDLLMTFGSFTQDAAYKDMKNIQQFYDDEKIREIVGSDVNIAVTPDKIRNLEFDVYIQEATTTAVYRDSANQFLMQLWQAGQISVEQLLQHGDFPYADELLQSLQAQAQGLEQNEKQSQQLQVDNVEPEVEDNLNSGYKLALDRYMDEHMPSVIKKYLRRNDNLEQHLRSIRGNKRVTSPSSSHWWSNRYPTINEVRRMIRKK